MLGFAGFAAGQLMDYTTVTDYLFSLKAGGAKFGIDRMRALADRLGHPERQLKIIHVAGTNGKGSVSAMCEAIARAAGYRTGLYTSPHLVRLGERVQVNRQILTQAEIIDYTLELKILEAEIAAGLSSDAPTFFEFMTAMAFLHFVRQQVDVAVVEVGLGGRLDATNVIDAPAVSVITSIALDHCELLGNSLAAIAREKAGIIKTGCPVVIGILPPEAEEVIREIAIERNAPLYSVRDRFPDDLGTWPETNLQGDHQRMNAGVATLVFEVLAQDHILLVTPEIGAEGLVTVEWAGRWQVREVGGKQLIFEAAHNPQGAEVLDRQLAAWSRTRTGNKPVIAVGALGKTRARALLEVVARYAREIVLFMPEQSRATSFELLESFIPAGFQGEIKRSRVADAFGAEECFLGFPGDTVVVTGSLYLIGEVMEKLEELVPVHEARLQD